MSSALKEEIALNDQMHEPGIAASIYCHELGDEVLRVVLPRFRADLERETDGVGYLWATRSVRCGEHIKLRVHAPRNRLDVLRGCLEERACEFFRSISEVSYREARQFYPSSVPIDKEDESETLYPDRSLLWRQYKRRPGTMGRPPLSDDDSLASVFTRCLSYGSDITLGTFLVAPEGGPTTQARISLVASLFLYASLSLSLTQEECVDYFLYHRDWLIEVSQVDRERLLEIFARRVKGGCSQLKVLLAASSCGDVVSESVKLSTSFPSWLEALGELSSRIEYLMKEITVSDDPDFLRDQARAPLFKSLHTLANLVRVGLMNEALICHHLAHAWERLEEAQGEEL